MAEASADARRSGVGLRRKGRRLNPPEQKQNDDDDQDQAEEARTDRSPSRAVAPARHCAEQQAESRE